MSSITDLYRKRRSASVASCAPPQLQCSSCGMLECVCRPRFFAGQVLAADDLNRLDAYIRAKHRLHNRQLHGFGVVNGLEVTCNPCGDGVSVSCGYALSPCGDDIVVCDTVTVDVCALINRCAEPSDPCDPPRPPRQRECSAGEEEWVLAIRYSETPTRGVKPLYGSSSGCRCGGGKSCSCGAGGGKAGCGCGGNKAQCSCGGAAATTRPRGAPVQCEPTVVCEGYAFEVYRAPKADPKDTGSKNSALLQRFQCCVDDLLTGAPQLPTEPLPGNVQGWSLWALHFKDHLLRRLQQRPGTNCELLDRLAALPIPAPGAQDVAALVAAIQLLFVVFIDALLNCLCSALLPPCPLPSDDDRVALATLHVASDPCRVLRVCNWSTYRQLAVTMPAIEYWLSAVPIVAALRELLMKTCCFDLSALLRLKMDEGKDVAAPPVGVVGVGMPMEPAKFVVGGEVPHHSVLHTLASERATLRMNPRLDQPSGLQGMTRELMQSFFGGGAAMTPDVLAQGLLGGKAVQAIDSRQLPQLLLMQQLARPLGATLVPELLTVLAGSMGAGAVAGDDLGALRKSVAELGERVQAQEQELAQLRAVRGGGAAPPRAKKPGKAGKN